MSRPLLLLAAAIAAGAFLGQELGGHGGAVLLALAAVAVALSLRASTRMAAAGLSAAALALGAAGAAVEQAGYAATPLARWMEQYASEAGPVRLTGVARGDAIEQEGRRSVTLDVESLMRDGRESAVRGRARVEVGGSSGRLAVIDGDRLMLWAQMRVPHSFGNPGSFDAVARARRDGVHALGHCKSALLVTGLGRGRVGWLRDGAARARRWTRAQIERAMLPGPEQGLVRAMVLGDRTGVDARTAEDFRIAGTYHVLALSGAQVAMVAGILIWLLRRLRAPPLVTAVVVCVALTLYAQFVGGQIPVTRAAVMASTLVIGRALDLDADLANLLGLAAAALLVAHPSAIGDVSFQLSFVATLGILLLTPRLMAGWPVLPLRLDLLIGGSLAAQAALAPLLIAHFHRLAPAALLLNLVAVPLSGIVLLSGAVTAILQAVAPVLGRLAGDVAWLSAHALLRSGQVMRQFPALDIRVPSPPAWTIALYLAGGLAWLAGRRPVAAAALAALGATGLLIGARPPVADGRLHLSVLDVGQGDCLVVQSPKGRIWLVDAGGSYDFAPGFDIGEAVVGPYLWSEGRRRIDGMVLTHAHPDHVGGAPFLLRSFAVGEVWDGLAPMDGGPAALAAALRRSATRRRAVARGVREEWDGVSVEVLGPAPRPPPWRTRNDDSIVLSLQLGAVRLLLSGDVEQAAESGLSLAAAEVLKVPHHGSRSSSTPEFLRRVSPRVAVISAGFRNRFGHPHADVLRRYLQQGIRVFRTDLDGAVTVSTDGERLWVRTFRGASETRILRGQDRYTP